MFVAYLVPKEDYHLVVEDGLHYVAVGPTEAEAMANLRSLFEKEHEEDKARTTAAGYEWDETLADDWEGYVAHTNKA